MTGTIIDINFPSSTKSITRNEMEAVIEAITETNIPTFKDIQHDINQKPTERWDIEAMEALEWIGLAHLKANRIKKKQTVSPFVSVYEQPKSLLNSDKGIMCKWKGFIPTTVIQNILTNIRKMMHSGLTNEWTSLTVWGYKDSPFTWNKIQHYQYYNGENDYTFLLLPKLQSAYTYQLYGSHHKKK